MYVKTNKFHHFVVILHSDFSIIIVIFLLSILYIIGLLFEITFIFFIAHPFSKRSRAATIFEHTANSLYVARRNSVGGILDLFSRPRRYKPKQNNNNNNFKLEFPQT